MAFSRAFVAYSLSLLQFAVSSEQPALCRGDGLAILRILWSPFYSLYIWKRAAIQVSYLASEPRQKISAMCVLAAECLRHHFPKLERQRCLALFDSQVRKYGTEKLGCPFIRDFPFS